MTCAVTSSPLSRRIMRSAPFHRPRFVNRIRHFQRLRLCPVEPSLRFDAQVQLQLLINTIHSFVVPDEHFDVTQKQVTKSETPVTLAIGQMQQPLGNQCALVRKLFLIAIAGLTDTVKPPGYFNCFKSCSYY
jgi:hypothetical protein